MKPLHLVMSAFGSYAGEERVDFSKAGNGVFLITGDTGAGKTTVFDAMVYALYDRTSGGERSGNMMRSQFAKPETETFVVFTFSVRNQIYTVRRNPEYSAGHQQPVRVTPRKRRVSRNFLNLKHRKGRKSHASQEACE